MAFELEESQWFDLQADSESESEDIQQDPHSSSDSVDHYCTSGAQTRNKCAPSSPDQELRTPSTIQSISTHNLYGSLSQHSIPLSHASSNSSLLDVPSNKVNSKTEVISSSNQNLSQHSLPVLRRSASSSHIHSYSSVQSTHHSVSKSLSQHSIPVSHRSSSSSHIHSINSTSIIQSTSLSVGNKTHRKHNIPVLHQSASLSHIHSGQSTSHSINKSLSQHTLPVSHGPSSSWHNIQATSLSLDNKTLSQHSIPVLHRSASTSRINNCSSTHATSHSVNKSFCEHSLPVSHQSSSSSNVHTYGLNSSIPTTSCSVINNSLSQYSHPVSDRSSCNIQTPTIGDSFCLNQYTVSADGQLSKLSNDSRSSSKIDSGINSLSQHSLPGTDRSGVCSSSQTVVGNLSKHSLIMEKGERNNHMDDTASQQFETLLANGSQETREYSADNSSKGLNLSEYPIDTLPRSPSSDQVATEDNSECDEVVQCAISEVSKDFLSGHFSTGNVALVESDSSQVSSDNEVKLAERSVHGKYPETAAGMSDNDWNPYVTESDSNASPRMEIAKSNMKGASVSTISLFSPPLSSTDNKTNGTDTVNTASKPYGYTKGQSSFAQNLTRSEENLRSFLGRDVEKQQLESHSDSKLQQPYYIKTYNTGTHLSDSISKDHAVGAQHAASYLTKSALGKDNRDLTGGGDASWKQMSSDDGNGEIASDRHGNVAKDNVISQFQGEKKIDRTAQNTELQSLPKLKKSYSPTTTSTTSFPENVLRYMENLPPSHILSSGASKVLADVDNILDKGMKETDSSLYSSRKDKTLLSQLPKEADAVEREVLSTEPRSGDFTMGNTVSQSSRSSNSGGTYSTTNREVQHLLEKDNKSEVKSKSETYLLEKNKTSEISSKSEMHLLKSKGKSEIQSDSHHEATDNKDLRIQMNDILTKTSYLEPDSQVTQIESSVYSTGHLPSSIDYSQLHHDLQEIQKSLQNFSEHPDSESGSECSIKLESKDASFASGGSTREGTIIPSTTTTPDHVTVQRRRFGAEGHHSVGTSQEDDTDQSDDVRKCEQNDKASQYNSEGEETHGSSCSAKGESDSGQRTPTFSTQQRAGEVPDVDEFLQNVRNQRNLILSQQATSPLALGMADQISHILQEENPRRQVHGILHEVDTQERELTEQISSRRMVDFSFTDTSVNYSHGSLIISDEDVRKQLHLSGLSSLDTSSYSEGYSDISTSNRPRSPFSAFKEARRFMAKQMEIVAETSFNHSLELRPPYRPVLPTYPVYGFKKDSEKDPSQGSRRSRRYEHFGVRDAWQRQHSERTQKTDGKRTHPEGTTEASHHSQPIPVDIPTRSDTDRVASSVPQREQVFVSQAISELQNPSVDPADIDLEESISDRRMASSPAGDFTRGEDKTSVASSQIVLAQAKPRQEPSEFHDGSSPGSFGVSSPVDSDGSGSRRREKYRPYRPVGSRDLYYTESDTTDSITTMESTHTGSDDAVPPYFPSHVLGSRKDTQAAVSSGVYGTKNQQAAAVALSTIEERSVVDDKERSVTSGARSSNDNPSSWDRSRPDQADLRIAQEKTDLSDSRGQDGSGDTPLTTPKIYKLKSVSGRAEQIEVYNVQDAGPQLDHTNPLTHAGGNVPQPEKIVLPKNVYVRDSATSPIIAYESSATNLHGTLKHNTVGDGTAEKNAWSLENVRSPTDIKLVKSRPGFLYSREGIVEKADERNKEQIPEPAPEFTAYEANVPSGSLPQATVVYSRADMAAHVHSGPQVSSGVNPIQQDIHQSGKNPILQDSRWVEKSSIQQASRQAGNKCVQENARQVGRNSVPQDYRHTGRSPIQQDDRQAGRSVFQQIPKQMGLKSIQKDSSLTGMSSVQEDTSQTGLNSIQPDTSQSTLADPPARHVEVQDEQHSKSETTQSKRPRAGRSELRDRIVQERNNRMPENSTSEEELEQRIDKTPISRKAQLLRETLEQELDLSIAPNINTMWQRFQELNSTETDSTMNTSRMETLAHLVRNPTKHTVQILLNQREQGRQQREEQVAEEREARRRELQIAKLQVSQDSDALYSIPENSFGSPSKLKSPSRKHENLSDPNMRKLRDKIQRQKDKIDKERKKEMRRMEKLMRLEQLLKAKRKGRISSHELSKSIDEVSSTTLPTESSTDLTSNESTISVSTNMSDTPTEETTAKDSSVELHLAKLAKGGEDSMLDSSMIDHLYKEAVHKHFHSKNKARPSRQSSEPDQHHPDQMLKEKGRQNRQQRMKTDNASFKENVESFDSLTDYRDVQRSELRQISPTKGKISAGFFPFTGETDRCFRVAKKTRDVGTIVPTPCNKSHCGKHKLRRVRTEAVQTSPYLHRLSNDRLGSRSPSPKYNSAPFLKKKSRSCSPPFSPQYTPEAQNSFITKQRENKQVSKGVAWFIELKDNIHPWKKATNKDHTWKHAPREDPSWRSPLKECQEKVREVIHTRPIVEQQEQSMTKERVKEVLQDSPPEGSLQEAFSKRMYEFISRSRERQKRLALARQERHMQEIFRMEHERLFGEQRKNINLNAMPHPLSERHYKPQKRILTKQEQKELTEKIYRQLPEVVNGKRRRRIEYQRQLNRLRARLFNKKVQRQVLRKAGVLA